MHKMPKAVYQSPAEIEERIHRDRVSGDHGRNAVGRSGASRCDGCQNPWHRNIR